MCYCCSSANVHVQMVLPWPVGGTSVYYSTTEPVKCIPCEQCGCNWRLPSHYHVRLTCGIDWCCVHVCACACVHACVAACLLSSTSLSYCCPCLHVTLISLHSLALCVIVREPLVTQPQARKSFFMFQSLVVRQGERKERNHSRIPYLTRCAIQGVTCKITFEYMYMSQ